jgi:hypothetical protein
MRLSRWPESIFTVYPGAMSEQPLLYTLILKVAPDDVPDAERMLTVFAEGVQVTSLFAVQVFDAHGDDW